MFNTGRMKRKLQGVKLQGKQLRVKQLQGKQLRVKQLQGKQLRVKQLHHRRLRMISEALELRVEGGELITIGAWM